MTAAAVRAGGPRGPARSWPAYHQELQGRGSGSGSGNPTTLRVKTASVAEHRAGDVDQHARGTAYHGLHGWQRDRNGIPGTRATQTRRSNPRPAFGTRGRLPRPAGRRQASRHCGVHRGVRPFGLAVNTHISSSLQ